MKKRPPIADDRWLEPPSASPAKQFLQLEGPFRHAVPDTPGTTAPLLLVEWPGSADQEPLIRPDLTCAPFAEIPHISDRQIVLLTGKADWYTFKRIAELLHAKLWSPGSAEELAKAALQLAGRRNERLALGGRHTIDGWFWLDGRVMDAAKIDLAGGNPVGVNQRFAALYQGRLCTTGMFDGALLELPVPGNAAASR